MRVTGSAWPVEDELVPIAKCENDVYSPPGIPVALSQEVKAPLFWPRYEYVRKSVVGEEIFVLTCASKLEAAGCVTKLSAFSLTNL